MDRRTLLKTTLSLPLLPMALRAAHAQDAPLEALVEGSRSEEGLLVYSGLDERVWTSVLEPFSGLYPWINVETLELSSSEITERYLAERSSGSRTADFIAHSPDGWLTLQERGEIMPHTSAEVAHFPAGSNPFPGLYTFGCDPLLLVWNKAALPAELAPTSFADMVEKVTSNQDLFRDRITTYNAGTGSYGYGINYAFVQHHGEKAWNWFNELGPLTRVERGSGAMMEKVTSGEYLLSFFCAPTTTAEALRDPARREIIGVSFISDGTPIMLRGAAVMMGAKSPNSAKLLLELMLRREGQLMVGKAGVGPYRTDVSSEDVGGTYTYSSVAKAIGEENITLVDYDPKLASGYEDFIAKWRSAYRLA